MFARPLSLGALALAALPGCVALQDTADMIAREQARSFVNSEMQRRFPGVDATHVTDCVIDNASAQEIVTIAGGIALNDTQTASDTVGSILQRPATLQCSAAGALGPLYSGGRNILEGFL